MPAYKNIHSLLFEKEHFQQHKGADSKRESCQLTTGEKLQYFEELYFTKLQRWLHCIEKYLTYETTAKELLIMVRNPECYS